MSRRTAASAVADVLSTLVEDYDVVSSLTHLVTACGDVQEAHSAGVLVLGADRSDPDPEADPDPGAGSSRARLELLAATSHEAAHLELYQNQAAEGPCLDAIADDAAVCVLGDAAICERWPVFGPVIVERGVHGVWAVPMRWRGRPFGGLNLFRSDESPLEGDALALTRTFADLATVLIMHARTLPGLDDLAQDVQQALDGRVVVEQAKGVLMAQAEVDAGEAFDLLRRDAERAGRTLAAHAARVVAEAAHGRPVASRGAS